MAAGGNWDQPLEAHQRAGCLPLPAKGNNAADDTDVLLADGSPDAGVKHIHRA